MGRESLWCTYQVDLLGEAFRAAGHGADEWLLASVDDQVSPQIGRLSETHAAPGMSTKMRFVTFEDGRRSE